MPLISNRAVAPQFPLPNSQREIPKAPKAPFPTPVDHFDPPRASEGTGPESDSVTTALRLPAPSAPEPSLYTQIMKACADLEFDYFASEASFPMKAVRIPGPVENLASFEDFTGALTETDLASLGLQSGDLQSSGMFESVPSEFYTHQEEIHSEDPELLAHTRNLKTILNSLTDTKVVVVGKEYSLPTSVHPVFIVGIAPDGALVGIQSSVVWT